MSFHLKQSVKIHCTWLPQIIGTVINARDGATQREYLVQIFFFTKWFGEDQLSAV